MALLTVGAQYFGSGAPSGQAGQIGDQYHDTSTSGSLYICTVAGSPGTWQSTNTSDASLVVSSSINGNLYGGDNRPASTTGSGSNNTTYGEGAGQGLNNSSANFNTLIGYNAGNALTNQTRVTALGQSAAASATGVSLIAIGPSALNSASGNINIGIGDSSLANTTSINNIGIGTSTLNALANSSSTSNTAIGYQAGLLHNGAGASNVFLGATSGASQTNYSGCTLIGSGADATTPGLSNASALGNNTSISLSDSINLGKNANVGLNNPSPAYNLDISAIGTQCTIAFDPTTATSATTKSCIYVNNTNDLIYQDTTNRQVNLSSPVINTFTGTTFQLTGPMGTVTNITIELTLNGNVVTAYVQGGVFSFSSPTFMGYNISLTGMSQFLPVRDTYIGVNVIDNSIFQPGTAVITTGGTISVGVGIFFSGVPVSFSGPGAVGLANMALTWFTS